MQRHHKETVISLDPNIRPGFISDAPGHKARMNRMIAMSDIVKVSDEDLSWLEPEKSVEAAIDGMQARGVRIVLLTRGSDGVSAYWHGGRMDVAARKVEVVDTIGAGDSFNGGFLAGLEEGGKLSKSALRSIDEASLLNAVNLANNVAAITVSRAGANPPWRRELRSQN